jgi:hypothetical protein
MGQLHAPQVHEIGSTRSTKLYGPLHPCLSQPQGRGGPSSQATGWRQPPKRSHHILMRR